MITVSSCSEPAWKAALEKYLSRASTRANAYKLVAAEFGYSVAYIKKMASILGLTSERHSRSFTFSEEEEQALVCACIVYARQGTPLTIPALAKVASIFADRGDDEPISRHFAYDFVERHKDEIRLREGKLTSPKRSLETMFEKTNKFIKDFEGWMSKEKLSEESIVVFDETIIGERALLPKVIGERRESGGGTINVIRTRERALGSYIPFSTPDGKTPFRVFIFNERTCHNLLIPKSPLVPSMEKGLRDTPYRLYLSSETGYINIALFDYIIEVFTAWWKVTHGDLECLLISDNLAIHKHKSIVDKAEGNGIHMLNIMAGSSHWFQVHDQLPFAILKKKNDM